MTFTIIETYSILKFLFFTSLIVTSFEQIYLLKSQYFSKLLPPAAVTILEHPVTLRSVFFASIYRNLFKESIQFLSLIVMIILSLFLIYFDFNSFPFRVVLIIFAVLYFVFNFKTNYGGDGAEQMSKIIFLVLFFSSLFYTVDKVQILGIFFIAAQVILSYFTAGISKIISKVWRNGKGLKGILSTNSYSTSFLSQQVTEYPKLTLYLSWYVILWELFFPFSLLFNEYVFFTLLFIAFMFHMSCALIMGLNNFFMVFAAAQICIVFFYYNFDLNFLSF